MTSDRASSDRGSDRQDSADDFGLLLEPAPGLRRHSVRQTSITLFGQVIQTLFQIVSMVVLARLLTPRDFGLVAMVAVVVSFIGLFRDIGLTQAVVQQDHLSEAQVNGLFWVNVAVTSALAAMTALLAPLIARFYREPDLVVVTAAFAGFLAISGLSALHQAVLTRRMEFTKIVSAEIVSSALGIGAAIALASVGVGYWALVVLPGIRALSLTVIFWCLCPWRPGRPVRGSDIRALLRFGWNVTGFNTLNFFSRNADNLLIGWRWGAGPLGLYSRAYMIMMLPLSQLNVPITRVAVPMLARLSSDPTRYRDAYLRIVRVSTSVAVPMAAFALVTADLLIAVVLGPAWGQATPILVWLLVAGLVQPLTNTTGWLFMTQNRTAEFFRWGVVSSFLTVAAFVVGLHYGATGVAAAYGIEQVAIITPVLLVWVGRTGPVSARDLLGTLPFPLALAAWVAAISLLLRIALEGLQPVYGLLLVLLVAVAGWVVFCSVTPAGRRLLREIRGLVRDLRSLPVA